MIVQTQVAQQHGSGEKHGGWIGLILAFDVKTHVSASGLEYGYIGAHVASWHDPWSADECRTDIGKDAAVQVGHDHDIELLGSGNRLHRCVIDDHVVNL